MIEERPEFVPEKYWDAEGENTPESLLEKVSQGYNELSSLIGQKEEQIAERLKEQLQAEIKEGVPESPDAYELSFGDVGLPEGELTVKEDDELMSEFRNWAHRNGLKPDAANEALNIYGRAMVAQMPNEAEEKAKIGENYEARLERTDNILKKHLDEAAYAGISEIPLSATAFKALENIANLIAGGSQSKVDDFGETSGQSDRESLQSELSQLMNHPSYWRNTPESAHIQARVRKLHEQLHGTARYVPNEG
jgi:hypothetical protein